MNKNIQNERNGKRKCSDKRADDKVRPAAPLCSSLNGGAINGLKRTLCCKIQRIQLGFFNIQ